MENPFPPTIRAGMTVEVTVDSEESTVKLTANSAGTVINLTAVDNGDNTHTFTFEAAGGYTAGEYEYVVFEEDLPDKTEILVGRFRILPDLASGDPRSQAQIILDAINAVIAGRATMRQKSVTVGDKSLQFLSYQELLQARAFYSDLVDQELGDADGFNRQRYYAEFQRP